MEYCYLFRPHCELKLRGRVCSISLTIILLKHEYLPWQLWSWSLKAHAFWLVEPQLMWAMVRSFFRVKTSVTSRWNNSLAVVMWNSSGGGECLRIVKEILTKNNKVGILTSLKQKSHINKWNGEQMQIYTNICIWKNVTSNQWGADRFSNKCYGITS